MDIGAKAIPVSIEKSHDGYQVLREGMPYYIKGAGGSDHIDRLAVTGGNSLRTWGSDQTRKVIDKAHAAGLTVTAGIWIEHQRHGFDYDDPKQVEAQISRHKKTVDKFKDHPALLMWIVGNEVWIGADNEKVWDTIETIAAYIKENDPAHPVMTVLPHVSKEEVSYIKSRCPSIDLLGFNSYGGLPTLGKDARRFGWTGPYVVTEWGPDGAWEAKKTSWGAEIEPTTTEKEKQRLERYELIQGDSHCLGSYAFFWGQKQETTQTWFNLFLEDDSSTGGVDALQFLWTGSYPQVRAPQISPLKLNGRMVKKNVTISTGESIEASFSLLSGDPETIHIRWECLPESVDKRVGGDREERPESFPVKVESKRPTVTHFSAPAIPGPYRLFVYLTTPEGKSASANFPFLVQ